MNLDAQLFNLITFCLFLILLAALGAYFRSAGAKGAVGEWKTRIAGKIGLPEQTYLQYHDLIIPTHNGTTQVDHVILSKYGVFVVETKHYTGWIFGSPNQAKWTQKIYKETFRFQNPLRQNFKHTKAVAALLNLPDMVIHSVIVFSGDCTFKTPMPNNVTTIRGHVKYVKGFTAEVLTDEQMSDARAILENVELKSTKEMKQAHIQQLKACADQKPIAGMQCPKCGSPLVMRIARKGTNAGGQFWGCSAFPRCRYTRNVQ